LSESGGIESVTTGNNLSAKFSSDKKVTVIDAQGLIVLPGFIQTHVHLCQALFRNWADDLELLDWLQKRIWPLEAAHTSESMELSARIGAREMLMSGTTTINDMASIAHTGKILNAVEDEGIRAVVGKCLMDSDFNPDFLKEDTESALAESMDLVNSWHMKNNGKIMISLAPRFALSCTETLLKHVSALAEKHNILIHTHASENKKEIDLVRKNTGSDNIEYLNKMGILGKHTVLAHCVHVNSQDIDILKSTGTSVAHCPSSNMKLSSGIAPVVELLNAKVNVGIGTDGAPCNNSHSMFGEIKLAGLCQSLTEGAGSLRAEKIIEMATIDGAKSLGIEATTGSIEVGKKADLIALDMNKLNSQFSGNNCDDISSAIVYSSTSDNLEWTMVEGRILYKKGDDGFLEKNLELTKESKKLTRYFSNAL